LAVAVNTPSPPEGEGGTRSAQPNGRVRGYSNKTLKTAATLRREMTDVERKLWSALRSRQLNSAKFRRQQPIGPFVADFVCLEHRLIVEADGGQHAESVSDARRTAFLQNNGYRVLRFWNTEILSNLDGVTQVIAAALSTPHPARALRESPSPSRGEGFSGASNG
jgi:very-short-patch-repair endonuclease